MEVLKWLFIKTKNKDDDEMKIIFDSEHQKYTVMKVLAGKSGCPSLYGLRNVEGLDGCGLIGSCKECWDKAVETVVIPREKQEVPECMEGMLEKFMEVR